MGRLLLVAALAVTVTSGARGDGFPPSYLPTPSSNNHGWGPHATSVTWPSVNPQGWYTNTYNHAWYYPWYANYNFTHGPYANWMVGGGYVGYANHGTAGMYNWPNMKPTQPYIGEWSGRAAAAPPTRAQAMHQAKLQARGSFDALQGLAHPLGQPREAYPLPTPKPMPEKK